MSKFSMSSSFLAKGAVKKYSYFMTSCACCAAHMRMLHDMNAQPRRQRTRYIYFIVACAMVAMATGTFFSHFGLIFDI